MNTSSSSTVVRVIDSTTGCPALPIVLGSGTARAVLWPGNGAECRTMQIIDVHPGDRTVDLVHGSDAVYYVMRGEGAVLDVLSGAPTPLVEGAMVHVDAGDTYRFEASATAGLVLVGGPCPPDPTLYAAFTAAEAP